MTGLEQVLADLREEATILRANGHAAQAATLLRAVQQVADACPDYLRWLSEAEAVLRSGKSAAWLRARYPEWEQMGHARAPRRGVREYRAVIIPVAPLRAVERQRGAA